MLAADLSAEILQVRKEWQDIFKGMKGKNLQPRLLYSKDSIHIRQRSWNFYRQAKRKRIQHHQTSLTTNDKERILKAAREKQRVNYKRTPIKLSADLSAETLQARREWQNIQSPEREKSAT